MSSEIEHDENQDQPWGSCPSGKLCQLNEQLKSQESHALRNRRMLVTGFFLLILSPAAILILNHNDNVGKDLGGITCEEVQSHFVSYSHQELDKKLVGQIQTHLNHCPMCRDYYEVREKKNAQTFFLNQKPSANREITRTVAYHPHSELSFSK